MRFVPRALARHPHPTSKGLSTSQGRNQHASVTNRDFRLEQEVLEDSAEGGNLATLPSDEESAGA